MWTSSTAAPAATEGAGAGGAERKVSIGRSRLPPAVSASAPTTATRPGMARHRSLEQVLDLGQVVGQTGSGTDRLERGAHRAVAVCSATIVPPKQAEAAPRGSPRRRSGRASSSAPGKRRTLAGRYV